MATAAASKLLTATAGVLTSSTSTLTHRRPLTCASGSHSPRLTPKPQDLIKWVRSKGGFVHPQLKIADHSSHGLGLVSDGVIPSGSELVSLPDHLTLRLRWSDDAQDWSDRPNSPLFQLVHRVPGSYANHFSYTFLCDQVFFCTFYKKSIFFQLRVFKL